MVEEIGLQRKTQKQKILAIRKALYKYGDIPKSVVVSSTGNPNEWVAIFDKQGNVLSAGRVVQSDWYSYTIKNIFTIPSMRGKGLGKSIVRKLVELATRRGAKVLVADVTYDNSPSKKIFQRLGFKVVSSFRWAKGEKPADILHFVLYPPKRREMRKRRNTTVKTYKKRNPSGLSLGFGRIGDYKIGNSFKIKL